MNKIFITKSFGILLGFATHFAQAQNHSNLYKSDSSPNATDTQKATLVVDSMLEKLVCSDVEEKIWLEGLHIASRKPLSQSALKKVFKENDFYYTLLPAQGKKLDKKDIIDTYDKVSSITESLEEITLFFTNTVQRAFESYNKSLRAKGKEPMNADAFVVAFAKGKLKLKNPETDEDYKEWVNDRVKKINKLTRNLEYGCNNNKNYIYRHGSKLGASIDLSSFVLPATPHTRSKVKDLADTSNDEKPQIPAAALNDNAEAQKLAHNRYNIGSIADRVRSTQKVGATFYFTLHESDPRYAGPKTKVVRDMNSNRLATVSEKFYKALTMQGSGILANGKTLNHVKEKHGIHRFMETEHKYGVGKANNKLVPWRSLAIDFDYYNKKGFNLKIGTEIYIPSTYGLKIPGTNEYHDGVWELADVGDKIKKERIDMFTGTMHYIDALRYVKDPSNYNDGKRNRDAEKLGSKSRQVAMQILR